ncbi:hypothetical protein QR680_016625 [Steinernema hermaphroditum]|uniref:Alpha-tubulin N-acetyltransferase n=1 Tax=Steinernema hermaphroditum TaxID=289476 RepID=A0AA39HBS7_9BILA|nr:hypothetical protein QR680_016625 [Steinernema hermaphroditum]
MEIAYNLAEVFEEPIQRVDRDMLRKLYTRRFGAVQDAIDKMGALSSREQGLRRILTSYERLLESEEEQLIYIMWKKHPTATNASIVVAMLKVGFKNLYLFDSAMNAFRERVFSVLDFYVYHSLQRQGNGHQLFDFMLQKEGIIPMQCAIDKPSDSLVRFMAKHYGLENPVWQTTNYVVYPDFFADKESITEETARTPRSSRVSEKAHCMSPPIHHRIASRDRGESVGGLLHGTALPPARMVAAPDTPQGLRNSRDFGHQKLW